MGKSFNINTGYNDGLRFTFSLFAFSEEIMGTKASTRTIGFKGKNNGPTRPTRAFNIVLHLFIIFEDIYNQHLRFV